MRSYTLIYSRPNLETFNGSGFSAEVTLTSASAVSICDEGGGGGGGIFLSDEHSISK